MPHVMPLLDVEHKAVKHKKKRGEDSVDLETIYSACSFIALIGWIALACAPLARERLIGAARVIALLLCVLYIVQMLTITEMTGGGFSTLAGVTALFSKAGNVMMGWTHYLAFDLFIGSWEVEDAPKRGIPHWVMIPILFLTLMMGPIGLLAYFIVRFGKSQLAKRVN
jgi:Domain of unknown function (DUF4281)